MSMQEVDPEYEAKMVSFEMDCNDGKGEPAACHFTAEFHAAVKQDYDRAAAIYGKNCREKGYAPSCFSLGRFYLTGKGTEQNDQKALELFERGCGEDLLGACYFQAMLLYSGLKPPGSAIHRDQIIRGLQNKDKTLIPEAAPKTPAQIEQHKNNQAKALKLFENTCARGEVNSCLFVGSHNIDPRNPNRDLKLAEKWLKRACDDSNHGPSCFNLAVLYKKGDAEKGFAPNPELSEKYQQRTRDLVKSTGAVSGVQK